MQTDTRCPKCGGPSRPGLTVGFRFSEKPEMKEIITQAFVCTSGCTQKIEYPEPGEWDLEFVILDGMKHISRPTAGEFA